MTSPSYSTNPTAQSNIPFYGRQTELAWLADRLSSGEPILALYGPRYIGKTTLLRRFVAKPPYGCLGIYMDAAQIDEWNPSRLLARLAGQVDDTVREKSGINLEHPQQAAFEQDPFEAWRTYVDAIAWSLDGKQIVLIVDQAHHAPPDGLAVLIDTGLLIILAVEQHAQLASCLGQGRPTPPCIRLGPLDNESAETMVKELISVKSQIDPWAVRRILEITSNQPHYIRQFCQHLLECCSMRTQVVSIDIEETLEQLLQAPLPEFEAAWNEALPLQRALLAVFSALRGQGGISTHYDLERDCARLGKTIPTDRIVETLEPLVQRQILEKLGTNSYRFELELFRLWVRARFSPEELLQQRFRAIERHEPLRLRLLERWPLWASIAAILVVLVVVALQPAIRNAFGQSPTPTATVAAARPTATSPSGIPTVTGTPPTPRPTIALPGYDLLLMSRRGADQMWQIHALNSNTGQRLRLTDTDSNERTPRWSPDGTRILFTSERDGNREVYVMNADGSGAINLTQHPAHDWQPAWSPDGTHIAFSSYRDENWEVYLIDADGSNLVRLTNHSESDFSPTWSPDGTKILFVSRRGGDADLFVLDLESRNLTQLTHGELDEYDPAWSPDGQWIAFTTLIDEQSDIFVMRADGSSPVNLTNSRYANDFQPAWTRYSEELIFVSYTTADGSHNLFRVRRDGRELVRLTDDDYDNISPCWRYLGQ